MPSRSYRLKQWPTRPNQEDGAQLFASGIPRFEFCDRNAFLSHSAADRRSCTPGTCDPGRCATCCHHARLLTDRPMQGGIGPPECALDISPSKRTEGRKIGGWGGDDRA
jgi:hypothetical protein